jgi:hypothetical protein
MRSTQQPTSNKLSGELSSLAIGLDIDAKSAKTKNSKNGADKTPGNEVGKGPAEDQSDKDIDQH